MYTSLTFLEDLPLYEEEKPFRLVGFPNMPLEWQSNCKFINQENVLISDVRGHEEDFTLDNTGFKFIKHASKCSLNLSEFDVSGKNEQNLAAYLEESLELAGKELGVDRITCFDWRIRKNLDKPVDIPADDSENFRHYTIPAAANIHTDFSIRGGWDRLAMHISDAELEEVKAGLWHVRFINIWRPLKPVKNAPLVLCDRQTVLAEDLVEVDKVAPDKVELTFFLKHRSYHKWYMLSEQQPDEVTFFTTWDSDNYHKFTNIPPHGAALSIGKASLSPPRESIEVRLLVMSPCCDLESVVNL